MEKAIVVKNITKRYKLYNSTKERILDLVIPKGYGEDFYALANVSFEANRGEVIGFIGINGSGKSTLSNIIAGIVPESSGAIEVNGQVALIAVAAGLKNDLTGRDNIELKLLMLGFNREQIKELEPEIIEFSELEQFIDQPVKSYSSGMKSRLGFAISVNVDPDILIIDEALSVGDKAFAKKSLNKMKEFKRQGKTMIFVSHSIGQMREFCDQILWLEFGMLKDYGPIETVMPKYESFLKTWQAMSKTEREQYKQAALENQKNILQGKKQARELNVEDFINEKQSAEKYLEEPISLLASLPKSNSWIYKSPKDLTLKTSSENYKNRVYYIRRRARYNGQVYLLLSTKPSAVDGVVGWMKREDLSIRNHVIIDQDRKTFSLKGSGKAFNIPWGEKDNVIYDDLSIFKNELFEVIQTEMVGPSVWHKGDIAGKDVWIRERFLNIE